MNGLEHRVVLGIGQDSTLNLQVGKILTELLDPPVVLSSGGIYLFSFWLPIISLFSVFNLIFNLLPVRTVLLSLVKISTTHYQSDCDGITQNIWYVYWRKNDDFWWLKLLYLGYVPHNLRILMTCQKRCQYSQHTIRSSISFHALECYVIYTLALYTVIQIRNSCFVPILFLNRAKSKKSAKSC